MARARVRRLGSYLNPPRTPVPRTTAWLATGPFLFFFNRWLHANLPWRLGPLRYVIATPAFHRWHHVEDGPLCNFAGVVPAWDLIFGTFYLPEACPRALGPGKVEMGWPFTHLPRVVG